MILSTDDKPVRAASQVQRRAFRRFAITRNSPFAQLRLPERKIIAGARADGHTSADDVDDDRLLAIHPPLEQPESRHGKQEERDEHHEAADLHDTFGVQHGTDPKEQQVDHAERRHGPEHHQVGVLHHLPGAGRGGGYQETARGCRVLRTRRQQTCSPVSIGTLVVEIGDTFFGIAVVCQHIVHGRSFPAAAEPSV
ncbi:hypothetical protein MKUB_23450 [Mycobacterium kubicae]|uniref:Uncharacterized protein n=1 Tax=Mycobacterium kubicae TaxID=120959 RepID=A0AAX1JI03_9MYCO|nr:hypothetical protein [Mycobacterium kubicae]MCV7098732.1 hypothetical protein [Mycobacterium kubicae]QNI11921.1 hypothetical protein GAN18_12500 [Mycobacterium kubicae]QPI40147.1 hypothetical protein I2456_12340 [Mycobacterium kubicae]GFG64855.1 hypothetical protein MKUB_23450 [Mycobacterium kubicae]